MNDVRVTSTMGQSVLITDLAMDVAHGQTVIIPGEKAAKSKDLWRLISQKQLFRLNSGPFQDFPPGVKPPPPPDAEVERLREENRLLLEKNRLQAEQNQIQAEQNQILRQTIETQGNKLDTILGYLETARSGGHGVAPAPSKSNGTGVVDAGTPTYVPSEIKPKNVESHVEVQSETSEGSSVVGAGLALRKLRRGR